MKRIVLALSTLAIAHAAFATVIYDTITPANGAVTFTTSTARSHMGDGGSTTAPINASWHWNVDSVDMGLVVATTRTYSAVSIRARFWSKWDATNTTNVFSGLLSDVTWSLGGFNGTANTYFNLNLPYTASNLGFNLGNGQGIGVDFDIKENGTSTNDLTAALVRVAPSPGTSTNGYYRDVNNDGIFQSTDLRSFGGPNDNLYVRINASAVPEPTSMALAGFGLVALVRKRTKKA